MESKKINIWSVVIVILGIAALLNLVVFGYRLAETQQDYSYGEQMFLNRIEEERYGRLPGMVYSNEARGVQPTEQLEECYAVARYFEAASYYKAAVEMNQTDAAAEYYTVMKEQESKAGELSYVIPEMQDFLAIPSGV